MESGAALPATAGSSEPGAQAGTSAGLLALGTSVGDEPVAAPLFSPPGVSLGPALSLPSGALPEPATPLWPPAGSLPWEAPPWA